jgi:hypothetical protein
MPGDRCKALHAVESDSQESHFAQGLLQCQQCQQLCFFAFHEEVDWDDCDDAQYWTYIPVQTKSEAQQLQKLGPLQLLEVVPRLQNAPKGRQGAAGVLDREVVCGDGNGRPHCGDGKLQQGLGTRRTCDHRASTRVGVVRIMRRSGGRRGRRLPCQMSLSCDARVR